MSPRENIRDTIYAELVALADSIDEHVSVLEIARQTRALADKIESRVFD